MATFPSITPQYGISKRNAPATRTIRFADGYEHRILFGLAAHQNPKSYSLRFEVSETEADVIEAFLDSRANDSASFDWTPLDNPTVRKWICSSWTKTITYLNRATITATFQEVFEP